MQADPVSAQKVSDPQNDRNFRLNLLVGKLEGRNVTDLTCTVNASAPFVTGGLMILGSIGLMVGSSFLKDSIEVPLFWIGLAILIAGFAVTFSPVFCSFPKEFDCPSCCSDAENPQ